MGTCRSGAAVALPARMLRRLLKYAILAPSSHNCQPWLFELGADYVDLFADRSRSLPVTDPFDRQLHMGCGAALLNLRAAVRRFGNAEIVELLPNADDPNHLARVRLGETVAPTAKDRRLFDAIPMRHTNRKRFEIRPVSHLIFKELAAEAEREGAWLVRLHPDDKLHAAEVISRADHEQFRDPAFRRELSRWLIRAGSRRRDGIPCRSRGFAGPRGLAPALIVRTFDRGDTEAERDRELAVGSPLLVMLGTPADTRADWLRAGQALQRVLLAARAHGISASFLNQAVEREHMRSELSEIADRDGLPQLVLRMGYGPEVSAVPRRPVSDVLAQPLRTPALPNATLIPTRRRPTTVDPRRPVRPPPPAADAPYRSPAP
jgi:nitroreductase